MLNNQYHKWIELSKDNLIHNILFLKSHLKEGVRFCSVVKSNAYGHGLIETAGIIAEYSDLFAVHEIREAKELIESGLDMIPILLLGPVLPGDMEYALLNRLHLTVYDRNTITALDNTAKRMNTKAVIHLKIDTGTSRQGIMPEDLENFLDLIKKSHNIELSGLSMHFANIEDTLDHSFAYRQLYIFESAVNRVKFRGFTPDYIHSACTAAALLFDSTQFTMVRSGIGLYGLWPSRETLISYRERHDGDDSLKPVLSLKTKIVQIKDIGENSPVGYGCSYITTRRTRIGVLPVGYADGYLRAFGNRASVIVNNRFAKVIGRVCMNLCMIDITDIPDIRPYDTVTLIGFEEGKSISVESLAGFANSINYEIVTLLNSSLPRIVV